jgi:nucleoid-associated protein YgaU
MNDPKKSKTDYSDVVGGSSSTPTRESATARTYTVVKGDSLSKIAQRLLGDADRWREIHDANRDQIRDPDLIQPGQVLKLPPS